MKKIVAGILAHVDAGKTSLSEGMLYVSNSIRKLGRVDHKDAFLDTNEIEKMRGITIFSKQAVMEYGDTKITLLDTPGHVDFSSEMERTIDVLDVAILVISAPAGVQGHTSTVWKLLRDHNVPTFIFVNKMDQPGVDKDEVYNNIVNKLSRECVPFDVNKEKFGLDNEMLEQVALNDEEILEEYLVKGTISDEAIIKMINEGKVFPCFFGSALKLDGVKEFMEGLTKLTLQPQYPDEFGAKVFKIARDEQGNKLTYIKVVGGSLKVKSTISGVDGWEEKINQIRIYSGSRYEVVNEVCKGDVCALMGIKSAVCGEGLGITPWSKPPVLMPVLNYSIILPQDCQASVMLPKLKQLEEEEPLLHLKWNEHSGQIQVQLMGEIQTEILKSIIHERFGVDVEFDAGSIVYKETITNEVIGVGHFEPLRHYAEVHLKMEPGKKGSGITVKSQCSEDKLDRNWQRLIMTNIREKEHVGVLTGSLITDVIITLISGRAHIKHTEGGDFRQAVYRAVRQGLMQADSVLLEPYYNFNLEIPAACIGRALADIDMMKGSANPPEIEGQTAVISGNAPVSTMMGYHTKVMAYTKGIGRLQTTFRGYEPCHNEEEIISARKYEPERDIDNTPDSVFCSHGAGVVIPWNMVKEYMHITDQEEYNDNYNEQSNIAVARKVESYKGTYAQDKELEEIFLRTFKSSKNDEKKDVFRKKSSKPVPMQSINNASDSKKRYEKKDSYLLVDGYNILFAWDELNELAKVNIDGARTKLLDIMCNYQGFMGCNLIVVFDAYKVKGHECEMLSYHNINVVYTKEAQTADSYIEQFAHEMGKKHNVVVATSDRLEQMIIIGSGCIRISARDFYNEVTRVENLIREEYIES